jgi:hypothetical protein
MVIGQEEKQHGVAILRLLEEISGQFSEARFGLLTGSGRSSYAIQGRLIKQKRHLLISSRKVAVEFSTGLFIKTSVKRLSPWRYSFTKDHQDEILKLKKKYGQVFLIFVNGDDGIACISFEKLKEVLDDNHEESEWVSVSRKPRETYRISGTDGKMEKTLPKNSFPKVISEYFDDLLTNGES